MFNWFETRLDPYPETALDTPPKGLVAFCWHYSKDAWPWLLAMGVLTALISVGEVMLFGFLGSIVDWLSQADPDGFLQREGWRLAAWRSSAPPSSCGSSVLCRTATRRTSRASGSGPS